MKGLKKGQKSGNFEMDIEWKLCKIFKSRGQTNLAQSGNLKHTTVFRSNLNNPFLSDEIFYPVCCNQFW